MPTLAQWVDEQHAAGRMTTRAANALHCAGGEEFKSDLELEAWAQTVTLTRLYMVKGIGRKTGEEIARLLHEGGNRLRDYVPKGCCSHCGQVLGTEARDFAEARRCKQKEEQWRRLVENHNRARERFVCGRMLWRDLLPGLYGPDRDLWQLLQDTSKLRHRVAGPKTACGLLLDDLRLIGFSQFPAFPNGDECRWCAEPVSHPARAPIDTLLVNARKSDAKHKQEIRRWDSEHPFPRRGVDDRPTEREQ